MRIRRARAGEMERVGDLRVAAYRAGGFLSPDSGYAPMLRALGEDGNGVVLVAVDGDPHRITGTVMLQTWPHVGRTVIGPEEAEIRALAVDPSAQGSGTGRALLHAAIECARQAGVVHLVLCTQPEMRAAHRLYEREGFARLTARDWSPVPGTTLLVYGLRLTGQ